VIIYGSIGVGAVLSALLIFQIIKKTTKKGHKRDYSENISAAAIVSNKKIIFTSTSNIPLMNQMISPIHSPYHNLDPNYITDNAKTITTTNNNHGKQYWNQNYNVLIIYNFKMSPFPVSLI
jgi:hypothetical protein